jgi:hypothetical protein
MKNLSFKAASKVRQLQLLKVLGDHGLQGKNQLD